MHYIVDSNRIMPFEFVFSTGYNCANNKGSLAHTLLVSLANDEVERYHFRSLDYVRAY